jgi:hypothetical protein
MRKARLLVDADWFYTDADFYALFNYCTARSVHVPVPDTDDTLSDAPDCETDSEYCSEQSDVRIPFHKGYVYSLIHLLYRLNPTLLTILQIVQGQLRCKLRRRKEKDKLK